MGRSAAVTSSIEHFDPSKNPTLARLAQSSDLPNFKEGEHFRVVCHESGSKRNDLPIFTSTSGAVQLDAAEARPATWRSDAKGVPGGFVIHDILTQRECDQLIKLSETMGYTEDAPVSLARNIRQNENCVWLADPELNSALFERCRPHFPPEVQGGEVCGMNARWRLYKYNPDDIFRVHTDGSWPGSGLDDSGKLVRDIYGDRWSQLTIVFYLNDEFDGGPTRFFFPLDKAGNQHYAEEVRADRGGAVCFFHGDHPKSPLHEGGLVKKGTKYIIRSDILYFLPGAGKDTLQDGWRQYYASLPAGQLPRDLLMQMMAVAPPAQRAQIQELLEQGAAAGGEEEQRRSGAEGAEQQQEGGARAPGAKESER